MRGQNWDDFRFVLTLFRKKTVAATAVALGVNESTVSRKVARVESRLGTKIFERSSTGFQASHSGLYLIKRLERVALEIETGEREVVGDADGVVGNVRITSVPIIINRILAPNVRDLLDKHPMLELELRATPDRLSLHRREADIAIRLARPESDLSAIARKIGEIKFGVYASRQCSQSESDDMPWVSYDASMMDLPQAYWIESYIKSCGQEAPKIAVNDAETLLECVRSGAGRTLLPHFWASQLPDLVPLSGYDNLPLREVWILIHPDIRNFKRIEVASDWVRTSIQCALNEK